MGFCSLYFVFDVYSPVSLFVPVAYVFQPISSRASPRNTAKCHLTFPACKGKEMSSHWACSWPQGGWATLPTSPPVSAAAVELCCDSCSPFRKEWREAQTSPWRSPPPDFFECCRRRRWLVLQSCQCQHYLGLLGALLGRQDASPVAMQGMVMLAASGWRCYPEGQGYLSSCIFCRLLLFSFLEKAKPSRSSLLDVTCTFLINKKLIYFSALR